MFLNFTWTRSALNWFGKKLYLSLLNRSLSASNMCLRLMLRAWAVYQSCSLLKLGSCVSPMMSRTGLLCSVWSMSLAEWDRRTAFWRTFRPDPQLPLLPETHNIHVTPPQGSSAGGGLFMMVFSKHKLWRYPFVHCLLFYLIKKTTLIYKCIEIFVRSVGLFELYLCNIPHM